MLARRSIALYSFIFSAAGREAGGRGGGRASLRTLCRRAAYLEHRTVRENSTAPIRSAIAEHAQVSSNHVRTTSRGVCS